MSDYETDSLAWSERQAELLRRVANGDAVNETPDWANIIEEVADVGRNTLRACRSQLLQALLHMLKAEAWPLSTAVPHWQSEARIAASTPLTHMPRRCAIRSIWRESIDRRCARYRTRLTAPLRCRCRPTVR